MPPRKNRSPLPGEQPLFLADTYTTGKPIKFKQLESPVWTANKAHLVAAYLQRFLYITKHGTYIDCFAGPQDGHDGNWAAELVLGIKPDWLRHFYLFEKDAASHAALQDLAAQYPTRKVTIAPRGDTNVELPVLLPRGAIRAKEATFCLLDQRTFECTWDLVRHLAALKPGEHHKPEQFYFLAQGWLGRALAATTTVQGQETIERWWGSGTWTALRGMDAQRRAQQLCNRYRDEIGYKHAYAWPIFKKEGRIGNVMYHMIHATDHDEAPVLMRRAYNHAVQPTPVVAGQLELDTADLTSLAASFDAAPDDE